MENSNIVRLVVEIEKDLHRRLKIYAAENDTTIRALIETQIRALLAAEGK